MTVSYPTSVSLFANTFHPLRSRVLKRYEIQPAVIRFYTWYRWCVSPYGEVVENIPSDGLIVDMGCGFGLLANSIRERHPKSRVIGVDIDERRISHARSSAQADSQLQFLVCDWFSLNLHAVKAFVFMDVLHHLSLQMQQDVLQFCVRCLATGGSIIIKDVDVSPRWKYACNWIFDHATSVSGVTRGAELNYHSSKQWAEFGKKLNLRPQHLPLFHQDYAPHFLLRLTK